MKDRNLWSAEEEESLKTLYTTAPINDVLVAIPKRSLSAIRGKAANMNLSRPWLRWAKAKPEPKRKKWTPEDIDLLKKTFETATDRDLRTNFPVWCLTSINNKAWELGLEKNKPLIKKMIGRRFYTMTVVKFSHSVNGETLWECLCDCGSVSTRGNNSLKTTKGFLCECSKHKKEEKLNLWTDAEESVLKEQYSKISIIELMKLMPNRTRSSIYGRAYKLGLRLNNKSRHCEPVEPIDWTDSEESSLIDTYAKSSNAELRAMFPNRTLKSILRKAQKLNLQKYKKTEDERLMVDLRGGARSRGLVFELTETEAVELVSRNCEYCGVEPRHYDHKSSHDKTRRKKTRCRNGIDRVDSSLGYVLDNCVPCCWTCNFAKRNMTKEAWYAYLKRLIDFQTKKGL